MNKFLKNTVIDFSFHFPQSPLLTRLTFKFFTRFAHFHLYFLFKSVLVKSMSLKEKSKSVFCWKSSFESEFVGSPPRPPPSPPSFSTSTTFLFLYFFC